MEPEPADQSWIRCRYFLYWDVPRVLAFVHGGHAYLLQSDFDDELDGYPPVYKAWDLSKTSAAELETLSWEQIERRRAMQLPNIPVAALLFDQNRERSSGRYFARFKFADPSADIAGEVRALPSV